MPSSGGFITPTSRLFYFSSKLSSPVLWPLVTILTPCIFPHFPLSCKDAYSNKKQGLFSAPDFHIALWFIIFCRTRKSSEVAKSLWSFIVFKNSVFWMKTCTEKGKKLWKSREFSTTNTLCFYNLHLITEQLAFWVSFCGQGQSYQPWFCI